MSNANHILTQLGYTFDGQLWNPPPPRVSDPVHPTNPAWVLNDALLVPPPAGCELLVGTQHGRLLVSQWVPGAVAWGYKPQFPATVKERERAYYYGKVRGG